MYSIRCKQFHVVNGIIRRVKHIRNGTIMLGNSTDIILVLPVFMNGQPYYPATAVYSSKVHKIMAQYVEHITLPFENKVLLAAIGYIAVTRVRNLDCIVPMLKLEQNNNNNNKKKHFINQ